jgi:hypothetical protein
MYADFYNAKNPPKKVDFLDAYVLTLKDRPHKPICAVEKFIEGEYKKYNNNWDWSDELRNTPQVFTHTALSLSLSLALSRPRRFRWTCRSRTKPSATALTKPARPQSFSHFTFEESGRKILVCDIQV